MRKYSAFFNTSHENSNNEIEINLYYQKKQLHVVENLKFEQGTILGIGGLFIKQ